MIELFKKMGCWMENDAYVPSPADIIFYDWQDSGAGDNTGHSDHVGIVEKVSGTTIVVIEGNYSDSVKRRTLKVNAKNIRGYGIPKYDKENVASTPTTSTPTTSKPETSTSVVKPAETAPVTKKVSATEPAMSKDVNIAGGYRTTANLNIRYGAGKSKRVMNIIPKGVKVRNYGFYTMVSGTKWMYVQVALDNVVYEGFCSAKYLDKV
jgi:hypothetical protein